MRTINVPTLPLPFLHPVNRWRFRFEREGRAEIGGVAAIELSFRETARPTAIRGRSGADLPASGSFWIEPDTGRVVRTLVRTNDGTVRSEVRVTYREDPALGLWVPGEMTELYETGTALTRGTATYANFRRFKVMVQQDIRD
jgi:hypothetical protein